MKKRRVLKVGLLGLVAWFVLAAAVKVAAAEEEDRFPLTLWGMWLWYSQYPQNQVEWDAERACLDSISANRLEACLSPIRPSEEEVMDSLCDNRAYFLTERLAGSATRLATTRR